MSKRVNLDMDVLRTFVTAFELGSFARAADRLGRSQSAVSTQLRKLEEQVGERLVQKAGRGLALTTAGESMLGYAKRLLELNDEAVETIRGSDLEGWARLGLPQDFAESCLPEVLKRFSRAHPKVRVEVQVDRSSSLVEKTLKGSLDVALVWGEGVSAPNVQRVAEIPAHWIGRPGWSGIDSAGGGPLPFVAFEPPCTFRSAAVEAMDAAGMPWRLVFTSPSLPGLWAAAEAGLGLTVRTLSGIPQSLVALDPMTHGLPALPRVPLSLHHAEAERSLAVVRLTEILLDTLRDEFGAGSVEGMKG
jgi:DNA-binding transcriptional LysR family regulator